MTSEFDLPCTACGGELREIALNPRQLGFQVEIDGDILVAECQTCGERYYPEQTLADLGRHESRNL